MPSQQKPDILPQHQDHQPGSEATMRPRPQAEGRNYKGSGKLQGKVAVVTGGDSGIGRATAIAFAKEGRTWWSPIWKSIRMPRKPVVMWKQQGASAYCSPAMSATLHSAARSSIPRFRRSVDSTCW